MTDANMKMPWEIPVSVPATYLLRSVTPITAKKVAALIYNFNGMCFYCEQPIECLNINHARYPTRDHKQPKARGGGNDKTNLVLACVGCNRVKSDMTEPEFRHFLTTGMLAPSYIEWLTTRFKQAAKQLGVRVHTELPT